MKFETWDLWYKQILDDLGFLKSEDEKTARVLNEILDKEGSIKFESLTDNIPQKNPICQNDNIVMGLNKTIDRDIKNAIVLGAGPSLKKDIAFIKDKCKGNKEYFKDYVLIVADGATTVALEKNLLPDIIVTDLDGKIEDLMIANEKGSVFVLHAHGNNLDEILKYTDKIHKVLGTTQSKPFSNLYNFGGFTDGDRAVFLAFALGVKKIVLAGMDFGTMTTNYSRPNLESEIAEADEVKKKKLKYAEELVEWIKENEDLEIINLSHDL